MGNGFLVSTPIDKPLGEGNEAEKPATFNKILGKGDVVGVSGVTVREP